MPRNNNNNNHRKPSVRDLAPRRAPQKSQKTARRRRIMADLGASVGTLIGTAAGIKLGAPQIGAQIGGALGRSAMARMSRIIGRGDYELGPTPANNSLIHGSMPANASFGNGSGKYNLKRREFVKNIVASGQDWTIDSVVVQPGLTEPFPLLSRIAACFTKYRIKGLVYEYVSQVSPYASVSAMGTVVMTFNPNQGDATYTNKTAMENSNDAMSFRPDKNACYGVECARHMSPLEQYFIRTGPTPDTATVAEDFGRFYIAQSGLPTAVYPTGTTLGELWVTYDIELDDVKYPLLDAGFYNTLSSNALVASPLGSTQLATNAGGTTLDVFQDSTTIYFTNCQPGSVVSVQVTWLISGGTSTFTPAAGTTVGLSSEPVYRTNTGVATGQVITGAGTTSATITRAFRIGTLGGTAALVPSWTPACTGIVAGDTALVRVQVIIQPFGQGQTFAAL